LKDSVRPNGLLSRYLLAGKVAVIIGDTIFIHGAINSDCVGYMRSVKNISFDLIHATAVDGFHQSEVSTKHITKMWVWLRG
jgi:hypothetical protein